MLSLILSLIYNFLFDYLELLPTTQRTEDDSGAESD